MFIHVGEEGGKGGRLLVDVADEVLVHADTAAGKLRHSEEDDRPGEEPQGFDVEDQEVFLFVEAGCVEDQGMGAGKPPSDPLAKAVRTASVNDLQ